MNLTPEAVARAVCPAHQKQAKLYDERGLFLLTLLSGVKSWRLRFRIAGREKLLTLGQYPHIDLTEARRRAESARQIIAGGGDPSQQRQDAKAQAVNDAANTFLKAGNEYLTLKAPKYAARTLAKNEWLLSLLAPLHRVPVSEITAARVREAVQRVESNGRHETAHRVAAFANAVLDYAAAMDYIPQATHIRLRVVLKAVEREHHAGIIEPAALGQLLVKSSFYPGTVGALMRLTPHLFARPGEMRAMEWAELDFDKAQWIVPAPKMKMRRPHVVPLSTQTLDMLRAQQAVTGSGRYVFPSARSARRCLSDGALGAAIKSFLDLPASVQTPHGFRTTASTLLNEMGYDPELIELQLSHQDKNAVRDAYNRAQRLPERAKMMQAWSDYLERLRFETATADFQDLGPA